MDKKSMTTSNYQGLSRWKYVFLGLIIMIFLGTVYSYGVFRLSIETLFSINTTQSGLPYMMALSFYALFMFLSGRVLERYKPRNIIIIGGALVALGWLLSAIAPNIYILTITYGCIGGAGVGIAYGVPMTVVAKWFPEKKGLTVGMVLVGFGLSPLITAPVIRILIENYSLANTFLAMGISFMAVLPFLAFPFKYPETEIASVAKSSNSPESENDYRTSEMIRTHDFKGLYINFIIATMVGLTMIGMTTNIGVDFIRLDASAVTSYMAVFAIFNGLGRPLFGWLTDRIAPGKAMILSYAMIMAAALLLIFGGEGSHFAFLVSFAILWFNLGGWLAIAPTSTMHLYGITNYSANYGVVFTAYGIGAIVGVLTSGMLLDLLGHYEYLFYYIIGLCVLGMAVTGLFFRTKK